MDLKRLRYAISLADELNFARAAEKLHLSQPALSRSIQTLEEELGMLVFDRNNRNVVTTTAGALFLERARQMMFQMRNLERDMELLRNGEIGQVAFGAGPLPTLSMLQPLVRAMRRSRPQLSLAVTSNNWRYLLQHLRQEEIEFFVADTRDVAPDPDITITPLCQQHGPFMCRAGHPLLSKKSAVAADMIPYGFTSLLLPKELRAMLRNIIGLAPGAALPIALECDNVTVIKQLAMEEDVILLATEAAAADEIRSGRLMPLHFKNLPPLYAQIGIVALSGRTLSPAAKLVIEQFQAVAATLPATALYRDGHYLPIS
ncbi:MAG: LysR family transcriptional regulator [Pseudomonadota bacterium]